MKTCPICKAVAFDDATVCYGCMHRFGEEPERLLPDSETRADVRAVSEQGEHLPSFQITLTPPAATREAGSWTCSVELMKAAV